MTGQDRAGTVVACTVLELACAVSYDREIVAELLYNLRETKLKIYKSVFMSSVVSSELFKHKGIPHPFVSFLDHIGEASCHINSVLPLPCLPPLPRIPHGGPALHSAPPSVPHSEPR